MLFLLQDAVLSFGGPRDAAVYFGTYHSARGSVALL